MDNHQDAPHSVNPKGNKPLFIQVIVIQSQRQWIFERRDGVCKLNSVLTEIVSRLFGIPLIAQVSIVCTSVHRFKGREEVVRQDQS